MAIKMVGKCKNCGAEVKVNEDQEKAFCQYCGAEFTIEEGSGAIHSITSMINKIDKRHVEQKKLDYEEAEKRNERNRKNSLQFMIQMMGLMLFMLIFFALVKFLF